jgi:tetratricopeptide (TPR) repeat protein
MTRRYFLGLLITFFYGFSVSAQQMGVDTVIMDSLKRELSKARTDAGKIQFLLSLAQLSVDSELSTSYNNQAVEVAEMSRDRKLMASTYLLKGRRYLNNTSLAENLDKALVDLRRAEEIARENNLEYLLEESYRFQAVAWHNKGNDEKALSLTNQAISLAGNTENDSVKVHAYIGMGDQYLQMGEKLLSFRNFLEALSVAEKRGNESLLKIVYSYLRRFYASIHEYAKAIDYGMKEYAIDRKAWDVFQMVPDEYEMGDLFAKNKQEDLALKMYENAIALADSVHYNLLKIDPYFRIFNMYFNGKQYVKGLNYLKAHQQVITILEGIGYKSFIDQVYAMTFSEQGKFDSADHYFRLAEPDMEKKGSPSAHFDFYSAVGDDYVRRKDYARAVSYYKKAFGVGEEIKDLNFQQTSARLLDSVYGLLGDFQSARFYNTRYHELDDRLREMSREADLLKLEVENDNQRRERLLREEEARMEHRHNVQYMGLTVGLVVLFIILVMLGWFAVPAGVIRALGFLSFIFLFEFIILLADRNIQRWTHEEPWKVLVIKIGLAAILVPLHHWLEHKVIHYLSHRKRVKRGGKERVPAEA